MYGLGIDIGAGSIKAGIFNGAGRILLESRSPTHAGMDNREFQNSLESALEPVLDHVKTERIQLRGIGIGSPGPIDSEMGIIHGSANLPHLKEFPINHILREKTGLSVRLNNDANSAALGEYFFGMGKGSPNLFVFTLGTGLGGGWVQNGHIYNGFQGNGMEVGHTTIIKDGAQCGCGKRGCAEAYFSAKGLMNRYREIHRGASETSIDSVADVFRLAEDGDAVAIKVVQEGTEVLAEASRNVINLLNCDTVVYVGGLTQSWDLFGNQLEERIRSLIFPSLGDRLKIFHGQNHAILGAGSLVLEE